LRFVVVVVARGLSETTMRLRRRRVVDADIIDGRTEGKDVQRKEEAWRRIKSRAMAEEAARLMINNNILFDRCDSQVHNRFYGVLRLREFRGLAPKSFLGGAGSPKSHTMVIILPSPIPSVPSPLPPLSNIKM
jgi:hypothetical protein